MAKTEKKLPRYLGLGKGVMWLDKDGEGSSGVELYAISVEMIGRGRVENPNDQKDKHQNKNPLDYGYVDTNKTWYIDTSKIDSLKLANIITAYNNGILIEVDPKDPPKAQKVEQKRNFKLDEKGDYTFKGEFKTMFTILQRPLIEIKNAILGLEVNERGRTLLMALEEYELKGYNPLSRPRGEIGRAHV